MDDDTARALVLDFIANLEDLRTSFTRDLGIDRFCEVVPMAKRGDIARAGFTASGVEYQVHGRGCMLIKSGREVDVDFAPEGAEIFDAWRIKASANDAMAADPTALEVITEACRRLTKAGRLAEPRLTWFSVAQGAADSGGGASSGR